MTPSPKDIIEVIKFIVNSDKTLIYRPKTFAAYIKDLYTGNELLKRDLILSILLLPENLNKSFTKLFQNKIKNKFGASQGILILEMLSIIYIEQDWEKLSTLKKKIEKIYPNDDSPEVPLSRERHSKTTLIVSFQIDKLNEVDYAEIITLKWKCDNPVNLILSDGSQEMDVTNLSSIKLSAHSGKYELILRDDNKKIIDRKSLIINFNKFAYCINCGTHKYSYDDIYCVMCGSNFTYTL